MYANADTLLTVRVEKEFLIKTAAYCGSLFCYNLKSYRYAKLVLYIFKKLLYNIKNSSMEETL